MELIEPDLCTYNIENLDEMYVGETEEDRKNRAAYYGKCLSMCAIAFNNLSKIAKEEYAEFYSDILAHMREENVGKEKKSLKNIEDSIADA